MTLKCIGCGAGGLRETGDHWTCERCGRTFPIVGGVSRFVRAEDYSESFGFQWTHFARTQLDSASGERRSREEFIEKTDLQPPELRGKRVLDAGCGMGRLAEVCAEAGAEVHAVDLSVAVEAAFRNLQHRPNLRLYQADIMHLPFEDETFDVIYSLGVLHHTPGTKAAFLRCPPC